MNLPDSARSEKRRARAGAGTIGGYLGFVFGLLCVLSVASEFAQPLPMSEAAFTVLLMMSTGYLLGWLTQPLVARLFPQP